MTGAQCRTAPAAAPHGGSAAMIYKFKSKATGDLIMLGPNGDQLLRLLGREPAPKGIIEVADMPSAAAARSRAGRGRRGRRAAHGAGEPDDERGAKRWACASACGRCCRCSSAPQAAREAIVWGV
jgi:hypothetical protein